MDVWVAWKVWGEDGVLSAPAEAQEPTVHVDASDSSKEVAWGHLTAVKTRVDIP
jgi:hypothetical protein